MPGDRRATIWPQRRDDRQELSGLSRFLDRAWAPTGLLQRDCALIEPLFPLQPVDESEPPPAPKTAAERENHKTAVQRRARKARA